MKVKRIMSNTATSDLEQAAAFYGDILGLKVLMDHGWFRIYGSDEQMTVQVSFGSEGGSGTSVPDLSIYFINDGPERALELARNSAGNRDTRIAGGADVMPPWSRSTGIREIRI